jgi:hypothetical protein
VVVVPLAEPMRGSSPTPVRVISTPGQTSSGPVGSNAQDAEQPSPGSLLPSSHCSPGSGTPSPHEGSTAPPLPP